MELLNDLITEVKMVYINEQTITGNGASQAATLPSGTSVVWITAEGGAVYAAINGTASASSGHYISDGQKMIVGPYSNLVSLSIFATSPAKAHLVYETQ